MALMQTAFGFDDGGHVFSRKRPRATPYDCPQSQARGPLTVSNDIGWMPWVVNPAKRIVSSGLSFLSKSLNPTLLPHSLEPTVSRRIGGDDENDGAGSSAFDYDFPDLYSLPNSENGFVSKDLTGWESFIPALPNSSIYEKQSTSYYDNLGRIETSCASYLTPSNQGQVIYDPFWYGVQETSNFVDDQYLDNQNVIFNVDKEKDDTSFATENTTLNRLPSLSIKKDTFQDLTYPKGDPDPVTIGARELEMLQPERFINDTVIDFYMKYLKSKIPVEDQHRFHFFNRFFSRKLADLDKNPSSANDGKLAFQRVRRWTRKLNLFEKEYIFIPVNYSLHWSLIIICHPGEVVRLRENENEISSKVPCILHMDSLKGIHRGLNNIFQSYLCEEWEDKYNQAGEKTCLKFLNLPFISPEVPQQKNSHDCGLFLLHYVELFLEAVLGFPLDNNNVGPYNNKSSNFLNCNWFPPEEASMKREHIEELIYEIAEHYRGAPPNSIVEYPTPLDGGTKEEIGTDNCLKEAYEQNFPSFSSNHSGCFVEDFQEACQDRVDISSSPKSSEIEAFLPQDSPGIPSDLLDRVLKDSSQEECMFNTSTVYDSLAAEHFKQNDTQPDSEVGGRASKRRKVMAGTQDNRAKFQNLKFDNRSKHLLLRSWRDYLVGRLLDQREILDFM